MQQLNSQEHFNHDHQFENADDLSSVVLVDFLSDLGVFDSQCEMVELEVRFFAVGVLLIESL